MRRKRVAWGCAGALVVFILAVVFSGPGKAVRDLWPQINAMVAQQPDRKYTANPDENLKAIYTAMMLYHESEGQFPDSKGWMDAIKPRLSAADLPAEEALKKLVRPDLQPAKPGVYGYSMNDAASKKYKADLKDPNSVLVFESTDTSLNAHGNPNHEKGRAAITIQGKIAKL